MNIFFRLSPTFNAFISNLPQVLDQNHKIGLLMAPSIFSVLQNSPGSSQEYLFSDSHSLDYSLKYFYTYSRRNWLMSVIVLLYKVRISILFFFLFNYNHDIYYYKVLCIFFINCIFFCIICVIEFEKL